MTRLAPGAARSAVPARPVVASAIDREAAERRLATLGLVAVLVVGAALRLWAINAVGLNSDEAVYSGQAAALAGNATYQQFFAVFRAHPLLGQFLLALVDLGGVHDVAGRLLAASFGIAAIGLTYAMARQLFSRRVALVAAAVLAVMPYHIAVSRQFLLDGPETTLWLLTMYLTARYAATNAARWLYAAAFAAGLTVLAKESAIFVVAVVGAFALMTPSVRLGWRRVAVAAAAFGVAVMPYPAAILLAGASGTARSYLLWELLRRPNHTGTFYFGVLAGAIGPVVLVLALVGIAVSVRRAGWQDRLLLAWIGVPLAFFEFWPVKGFQYLLPIAPAIAIAAARTLDAPWSAWLARPLRRLSLEGRRLVGAGALAMILVPVLAVGSMAPAAMASVANAGAEGSLAGTGGLPGGREAGLWIRDNVPAGASFMTIGPTLSNVIQFYGLRHSYGLSVSPNPQRRNPSYKPIINPDYTIRSLRIQYAAWDVWSASRSSFFAATLRRYIVKYHGRLIYEQRAATWQPDGSVRDQVVIQVYQLRP